jgi:hypothetical protein
VTATYGRLVEGIAQAAFRPLEDGIEQDMSDFFIEDGLISLGWSWMSAQSIRNKLAETQRTISEFLGFVYRRRVFLVTFSDQPELVRGFDRAGRCRSRYRGGGSALGWTALYDAMVFVNHMSERAGASPPGSTDGGDNNSRYSQTEVKTSYVRLTFEFFRLSRAIRQS